MLKNISNLGKVLTKTEQKEVNGGRLDIGQEDGCHWSAQCLNQWGRCTSTMSCNCIDTSENHYSCNW
jgi:hypothetical protein